MNTLMSYQNQDFNASRPRAFSYDGQPAMMQAPAQGPASPRYYPSNQPSFRPAYGAPGVYQQTAYPAYTPAGPQAQPIYTTAPQPAYTTGPAYTTAPPMYTSAPAQFASTYNPTTFNAPMGAPPGVVSSVGPGVSQNNQICCPLPGPTENPQGSQSAHAFQSNLPAGECEGLVRRDVEYQTEWVAVPVQKPVVYETYQRVVEIPTQHLVNVQNVPGNVPARQCDVPSGFTSASVGFSSAVGQPQITYGAPQVVGASMYGGPPQVVGAPSYGVQPQITGPPSYAPPPQVVGGQPYGAPPQVVVGGSPYGAPQQVVVAPTYESVYGSAYQQQVSSGAVSPVPWSTPMAAQVGGPIRTFSL